MQSTFLKPGVIARDGQLASLHIRRDQSVPVILSTVAQDARDKGYAEGVVTNTKFGSFPHSTLLNTPWGSQIRASKVDTGSRGRPSKAKKRKAEAISNDDKPESTSEVAVKEAEAATSGFIHLLPPTPESWTTSLPHRTQVVYTPDYSYILHRIRARPGAVLIEAGSGSGSFTHAAARAVFNGVQHLEQPTVDGSSSRLKNSAGHVYSFEFHPERHQKLLAEVSAHGLTDLVTATHRDVYKNGFLLTHTEGNDTVSPRANAVFLDLPAPWEALPHLTRQAPSPLDPLNPVYICTFSPCIEQAQKTISVLRRHGWIEIEMVEIQHRRIEVRREITGFKYDGMRSVNVMAEDVEEAVAKLRENEERGKEARAGMFAAKLDSGTDRLDQRQAKQPGGKQLDAAKVLIDEGRIIHRSEPDLKTHTSYLVFAILTREWNEEDEEAAKEGLQESISTAPKAPKSHRQLKREAKLRKRNKVGKGGGGRDGPNGHTEQPHDDDEAVAES